MTGTEGNVTLEPGPHGEFYSCQRGWVRFQHLVPHHGLLATHRDHLGRGSGVLHVFCWQLVCEMTDRQAQLSAATRFPLQLLSSPGFVSQVLFCRSLQGKKEWSNGPFPRCSWLTLGPRRLQWTLPKQRVCLCRCPNSQPTHTWTLAQRQRNSRPGKSKNVILIPSKASI